VSHKKPHILVVVNVFRPDLGGGILFSDLCDGLSQKGFDVTVRCAYPYYPQWRDTSGQNGIKIRTEISDGYGYKIERFGLYIPTNPNSLLQRLLYEASFFLSLLRRLPEKGQFDAMLVFSPLIGSVAYASVAAAWARLPWWLNIQDLSAQAAAAGGISSSSSFLIKIQNALFRRSPVWSSISAEMVDALQQIPGSPKTVQLIPNWLHSSLSKHLAGSIAKAAPQGKVRLFYSGNIGGKQNLLGWCKKLAASNHEFYFRIHGEGGRASEVAEWIEKSGDPRFELHSLTDEAGLAAALRQADFYVITERTNSGNSFVPSKLIPGMTSATPILAVCDCDGPLGREVSEHQVGYHIPWEDDQAIARLFELIRHTPSAYSEWSQNAINRSSYYDRERAIQRCVQVLNEMMAPSIPIPRQSPQEANPN